MRSQNLIDHVRDQERRASRIRRAKALPVVYGNFIAHLAPWDWFITITFRDLDRDNQRNAVCDFETMRLPGYTVLRCDPQLTSWRPSSKYGRPLLPVPGKCVAEVKQFMYELQAAAGHPIGWLIPEEFGRLGGRWHCHPLVSGVAHLRRDEWWEKAFDRFGRTTIERFDPNQGAAFYAAKYAAKELGELHFGGTLADVDLERIANRAPQPGGAVDVVKSAPLPKRFFHNTLGRRHR